jgi:hypothetical protein
VHHAVTGSVGTIAGASARHTGLEVRPQKVDPKEFARWLEQTHMQFMVDAFCDPAGHNRQIECYWSDALTEEWEGLHIGGTGLSRTQVRRC